MSDAMKSVKAALCGFFYSHAQPIHLSDSNSIPVFLVPNVREGLTLVIKHQNQLS